MSSLYQKVSCIIHVNIRILFHKLCKTFKNIIYTNTYSESSFDPFVRVYIILFLASRDGVASIDLASRRRREAEPVSDVIIAVRIARMRAAEPADVAAAE